MPIFSILKSVRFWLFALAIVLSGLLLLRVVLLELAGSHRDKSDYRRAELRNLSSIFRMYKIDYGSLPSEAEFKDQVKEYLQGQDMLMLVRYFCKESSFVLVNPGSNGKFDTPEGYDALKNFKNDTDDIVEWFGRIR